MKTTQAQIEVPSIHNEIKMRYGNHIYNLPDSVLFVETKNVILAAAKATDTPESALHWQRHECYLEWMRRKGDDFMYVRALEEALLQLTGYCV
jgi:hypothetical protein